MPFLRINLEPRGAIIGVAIGVSGVRAIALQKANLPVPELVVAQALIDTGASCTCVDPDVIARLGITPTGTTSVHTPSTGSMPQVVNQFDVAVLIAMDNSQIHVPSPHRAQPVLLAL